MENQPNLPGVDGDTLAAVIYRIGEELDTPARDISEFRLMQATPVQYVYRVYRRGSRDYEGGMISLED